MLSQEKLKDAARLARVERVYETFSITESFRYDEHDKYDLFISHSFSDKDLVVGLRYLFDKAGYKVYIDWIEDSHLNRNNVTKQTAAVIKNRIKCCKGLAYISTENITSSKWCPWELGVADGMLNQVCILPVMNSQFKGQEYLSLYPYMDYQKVLNSEKYEFWIYDPDNRDSYIILRDWLKGRKPFPRK